MRYIFVFAVSLCLAQFMLAQGNLYVGNGATLYTNGGGVITLNNTKLTNAGTVNVANGTAVIQGNATTINSSIGGGSCTLEHLTLDKAANDVQLSGNITITGNLTFTNGSLDVNGNIIDLQTTGTLQNESNTSKAYSSTGSGSITASGTLNAPTARNLGNLGLHLTSSQNLGATSVVRYFNAVTAGSGTPSILRNYQVTPSNNSGLNANIRVDYFESELNSQPENNLVIWTGLPWQSQAGSTRDVTNNYVEYAGLGSLNTVSIGIPLSGFSASLLSAPSYYCAGAIVSVIYNAAGNTFQAGNVFSLQLSDASGSFASPTVLGTLTSIATTDTISGMIPWAQGAGLGYRVRVVSSNVAATSSDNGSNFEIKTSTASANVTFSGGYLANPTATGSTNKLITGCQGTNVILTANVSNAVSHQWRRNGVQMGATSAPTLTVNSNWGDYELVAIDANGCGAAADTVGINLKPTPIANAGIDRNICPGSTTITKIGVNPAVNTPTATTTYAWTSPNAANLTYLSSSTASNPTISTSLPTNATYALRLNRTYIEMSATFSCLSSYDSVVVTVLPRPVMPTVSIVAGSADVCEGTTVKLYSTKVGAISTKWYRNGAYWSNVDTLAIIGTNGVSRAFTAEAIGANTCASQPSAAQNVIVRNAPIPTITSSPGVVAGTVIKVCPSISSAILTANITAGTPTYQWFKNGAAVTAGTGSTLAISGITTTNTSYRVRATYTYGSKVCTVNSSTMNIRRDATAGNCRIKTPEELENSLSVYPNPTAGEITANVEMIDAGEATFSLVNHLGQIVWSEKRTFETGNTEVQLSLDSLPSGIYHLTLTKEGVQESVKIVKE